MHMVIDDLALVTLFLRDSKWHGQSCHDAQLVVCIGFCTKAEAAWLCKCHYDSDECFASRSSQDLPVSGNDLAPVAFSATVGTYLQLGKVSTRRARKMTKPIMKIRAGLRC